MDGTKMGDMKKYGLMKTKHNKLHSVNAEFNLFRRDC